MTKLLFIVVAFAAISCSGDDSSNDSTNTADSSCNVSGKVSGVDWTCGKGRAEGTSNEKIIISLFNEIPGGVSDVCSSTFFAGSDGYYVSSAQLDTVAGASIESAQAVNIYTGVNQLSQGRVLIESIDEEFVAGTIDATSASGDYVKGSFRVKRCL